MLHHFGLPGFSGNFGVLIFFVLSGFLITLLLLKEEGRTGRISLRLFYLRRSIRILPAFYVYAPIAMFTAYLAGIKLNFYHIASSLLYVCNYYQALKGLVVDGFSHTWSLGVEEQFYLLWPLALIYFCKRRISVLAATIVAVWSYRALLIWAWHVNQIWIFEAFDTRCDHLLVGCLLACLLQYGVVPRFWQLVCSPGATFCVMGSVALSVAAHPYLDPKVIDSVSFIIEPLLVALLLIQLVALSKFPVIRWLELTPVVYLGRISYSLYLYQELFSEFGGGMPLVPRVVLALGAAAASYHLVEKPLLQFGKKRFVPRVRVAIA